MFQATVSAYMLSSIFLELRLWATVFQAKTLEISFLDNCSFSLNCMSLCTYACTIMKVYPLRVDYIIWLHVTWLSRDKRWQ